MCHNCYILVFTSHLSLLNHYWTTHFCFWQNRIKYKKGTKWTVITPISKFLIWINKCTINTTQNAALRQLTVWTCHKRPLQVHSIVSADRQVQSSVSELLLLPSLYSHQYLHITHTITQSGLTAFWHFCFSFFFSIFFSIFGYAC